MAQGQEGPPDLEEMWRDFTRKLSSFFGVGKKGGEPGNGGFQPDARSAGVGAAVVALIVVVVWLFSGSFIVQEGQRGVVTTFGRYSHTVEAGWGWRWPYPIQAEQTIDFTQTKTVEIGGNSLSPSTGLRDSAMLTQDENIVEVQFSVQYNLKDARAFLYSNANPGEAIVRRRRICGARDRRLQPDRLGAVRGTRATDCAADQEDPGTARHPRFGHPDRQRQHRERQSARAGAGVVHDVVKAGVDRDALKNEGQAYANQVIPAAQGDGRAAARGRAGLQGAHRQRRRGRRGSLQGDLRRVPEGAGRHARPHVHRRDAGGLLQRHQGDGGHPWRQQPDPAAAGQAHAGPAAAAPAPAPAATADAGTTATVTVTPLDSSSSSNDPRARDNSRSRDRDSR
jgi:membrane protease subunit HflK